MGSYAIAFSPFVSHLAREGGEGKRRGGVTRWGLFLRRGVPLFDRWSSSFLSESVLLSEALPHPIILSPLYVLVSHHPERGGRRWVFGLPMRVFLLWFKQSQPYFDPFEGNATKRSGDDNNKS